MAFGSVAPFDRRRVFRATPPPQIPDTNPFSSDATFAGAAPLPKSMLVLQDRPAKGAAAPISRGIYRRGGKDADFTLLARRAGSEMGP